MCVYAVLLINNEDTVQKIFHYDIIIMASARSRKLKKIEFLEAIEPMRKCVG